MCLIALYVRTVEEAPLVLAAHRDEFFTRPSLPPQIREGSPRVLCGTDARAGGTWLGVNEHGLVVAVTNRPKQSAPAASRSRGLLCRDLLLLASAESAAAEAEAQLAGGCYDGANYLCADRENCFVVLGGDRLEVRSLAPGVHLLGNGDPDDPQDPRLERARQLLPEAGDAAASLLEELADRLAPPATPDSRQSIVLRSAERGTVSSTLLALTDRSEEAIYRYADGPPDLNFYDDYSPRLQKLLAG